MEQHSYGKKIAAVLLFISLISGNFLPSSRPSDCSGLIERAGVALNMTGPAEHIFRGGSLTMLANSAGRQMLSMILEADDGTLVVIDGGWSMDAYHLTQVLKERGGHVSAWFLTHPHNDHVGAFIDIVNDPESPITIDHVYYALADQSWYDENESFRSDTVTELRNALSKFPAERLHNNTPRGQQIAIGGITAQFMNNIYLLDETPVNNSSMVVKFTMDGLSILVLGDLGASGGRMLLAENGAEALKSDIVQMAHHGQSGVEKDIYTAICPSICLWPTPKWLWNNDEGNGKGSGNWYTLDTRAWMDELGVKAHYGLMDGDWVIY